MGKLFTLKKERERLGGWRWMWSVPSIMFTEGVTFYLLRPEIYHGDGDVQLSFFGGDVVVFPLAPPTESQKSEVC